MWNRLRQYQLIAGLLYAGTALLFLLTAIIPSFIALLMAPGRLIMGINHAQTWNLSAYGSLWKYAILPALAVAVLFIQKRFHLVISAALGAAAVGQVLLSAQIGAWYMQWAGLLSLFGLIVTGVGFSTCRKADVAPVTWAATMVTTPFRFVTSTAAKVIKHFISRLYRDEDSDAFTVRMRIRTLFMALQSILAILLIAGYLSNKSISREIVPIHGNMVVLLISIAASLAVVALANIFSRRAAAGCAGLCILAFLMIMPETAIDPTSRMLDQRFAVISSCIAMLCACFAANDAIRLLRQSPIGGEGQMPLLFWIRQSRPALRRLQTSIGDLFAGKKTGTGDVEKADGKHRFAESAIKCLNAASIAKKSFAAIAPACKRAFTSSRKYILALLASSIGIIVASAFTEYFISRGWRDGIFSYHHFTRWEVIAQNVQYGTKLMYWYIPLLILFGLMIICAAAVLFGKLKKLSNVFVIMTCTYHLVVMFFELFLQEIPSLSNLPPGYMLTLIFALIMLATAIAKIVFERKSSRQETDTDGFGG